ncbi:MULTISPECIES: hypothetical protein [unclassified Sphingopyxis]|nr:MULTISPECIES: hypothetical protein [unclassified Sphingopyxis]
MKPAAEILVRMARDSGVSVISEFGLYILARKLFADRGYAGIPIPPRNRNLTYRRARNLVSEATCDPEWQDERRLPRDEDFSSTLFTVAPAGTVSVMLAADPFACLSHGSALSFHGLAPEPPEVHLVTPERAQWQQQANAIVESVMGWPFEEIEADELPFRPTRPVPHRDVRGRVVHRHEMRHPIVMEQRGELRAAAIGETFRDALDKPDWCGGIEAVIDVWRRHALKHLDAIIATVSASSEKILRVRAGYLLEEVLGIDDIRITAWAADAQRGSSRKLDSAAPYASRFSARWMLSINVADSSLPSTTKPEA